MLRPMNSSAAPEKNLTDGVTDTARHHQL